MSDTPLCHGHGCARPSPHGFVCPACMQKLQRDLREIDDVLGDLLDTITRQDRLERTGAAEPGLEPEPTDQPVAVTPMMFAAAAAEAGRDLHAVLSSWVRHLIESRGLDVDMADVLGRGRPAGAPFGPLRPPALPIARVRDLWRAPRAALAAFRFPGEDTVSLARWLARHPDTIAHDPGAPDLADEIHDALRRARKACDVTELTYMGPCSCSPTIRADWCPCDDPSCPGTHGDPVDLYAPVSADFVICTKCGESFPVAERRAWLVSRAEHQLLTATDMSRALARLLEGITDRPLTAAMIRGYAHRGAIREYTPDTRDPRVHTKTGKRHPRYRVGEVMAHLQKVLAERQAEGEHRAQRAEDDPRVAPDQGKRYLSEDHPRMSDASSDGPTGGVSRV